ncbi:MAG TPA: hypothetical protein VK629_02985, partial [Steroidobacteraceae bacterium]|nr:hypothetical protein [Steroidobacteraceae bacterium]
VKEAIIELGSDPWVAHKVLFAHRHPNESPAFHAKIIEAWHSEHPRVLIKAFRGAAKSTIAEEAICVQALFRQFRNGIILGETVERAIERLRAIKHEFETNPIIEQLFGNMVGSTWTETKIILANGVIIQAFGRGQSLRGSKHLDFRPDRAFGDDIENEESVATEEAIAKCMRWLMSVVIPALDPSATVRINGTPLHPKSVIEQLSLQPNWQVQTYPIEHVSAETGEPVASWPSRFPVAWIAEERRVYQRLGLHDNFEQEFMCRAEDLTQKPFTAEMFRVEPTVRVWEAVYAMYDPARTVNKGSASTGVAIWSWINNRLIVWDAYAGMWKPDEIISDIFRVDEAFGPVTIGVERDGLEEFILQPLRQEQLRRSYAIPIRPLRAPKSKLDFIKGLQPFFKAREVIFAKDLPDAREQFLGFPTGRIDVPNALAFALLLRPGAPIYDDFSYANVADELHRVGREPVYLAVNTNNIFTTAVLVQIINGGLHVLRDWVREGDAGANLADILASAGAEAGGKIRVVAGPDHFRDHDTLGLRAAARRIPVDLRKGTSELIGREEIRGVLGRNAKGYPALRVSLDAKWTLNAFAAGFCKEVSKHGVVTEFPVENEYRVLVEGLEQFAGMLQAVSAARDDSINYQVTADGRRYISALVQRPR